MSEDLSCDEVGDFDEGAIQDVPRMRRNMSKSGAMLDDTILTNEEEMRMHIEGLNKSRDPVS